MKTFFVLGLLLSTAAFADGERIVIGYPNEGKVDVSLSSCREFVKDVMGSGTDDPSYDEDVVKVCAARNAHLEAHAGFEWDYKYLSKTAGQDRRLNFDAAVKAIKATVRDCVEFRTKLTTGGHNIAIDIIPNEIAASCLKMGSKLMNDVSVNWRVLPSDN